MESFKNVLLATSTHLCKGFTFRRTSFYYRVKQNNLGQGHYVSRGIQTSFSETNHKFLRNETMENSRVLLEDV